MGLDGECIETPHRKGPGYSSIKGEFAHRYVMRELHVPIEGMVVRHLCFNRRCCNPDHLTVGTMHDNAMDADAQAAFKKRDALRFAKALDATCPKCGAERKVYVQGNRIRIRCNKLGCY
jgi:HNH endonuclease